jgi:hypothetical protein
VESFKFLKIFFKIQNNFPPPTRRLLTANGGNVLFNVVQLEHIIGGRGCTRALVHIEHMPDGALVLRESAA